METVRKVNEFLASLNGPQLENQGGSYVTHVPIGSAIIMLFRNDPQNNPFPSLVLRSEIVDLPRENIVGLYRFLLEKNADHLGNFCFSVIGNRVIAIETMNNVTSMNKEFFFERLGYFANLCDDYDDELISRFNALCIE